MAKEPSRTIGKIDCMVCGEEMPVRQNGRDTLNLSCPWCGHSSYAKGGTGAHGIVIKWIRTDAVALGDPAVPVPVAEPAPLPAKKPAAMPWEL